MSARGHPGNLSWYEVSRDGAAFEIHSNLSVHSATVDEGVYVVDVGVIVAGCMPTSRRTSKEWKAIANADLVSFIEAKKLVIYPMLLAQFIGIVHEIKPECLGGLDPADRVGSFYPALVSLGYLKGTSRQIVDGYVTRGFRVNIVPTFDECVVLMARDESVASPFRRGGPVPGEAVKDSAAGRVYQPSHLVVNHANGAADSIRSPREEKGAIVKLNRGSRPDCGASSSS